MAWRPHFERGITLFKQGQHAEALKQFNDALANGGENQFILYDSRAAVYECLNNPKDALHDAKTTIKIAPQRWHGYARAARLFMKTHKFDASAKMVDLALSHVRPEDLKRREELLKLKQEITSAQEAVAARERRMRNHMLKLPLEIYGEIFQLVLAEDHTQIFTLLHVCAHWRQIVWDAPGLWHTLVLSKTRTDKKAALWLERSRGRIRELHVLSDYNSTQLLGGPTFLYNIEWSHLRVCRVHHPYLLKHINPHTMFRDLEHLEINTQRGEVDTTFFSPSTNLKSLSILETELQLEHLNSPYPSLTSLHLAHCFLMLEVPNNFITILNANPQIETLYLESLVPTRYGPIPLNPSDITDPPDLKNLTTFEAITNSWASFILLLNIPALQTLRFEFLSHSTLNNHFTHWLSTSPKFLTELSLKNTTVNKAILIELVRAVPTIEVLTLVGMYDTSNVVVTALVEMSAPLQDESNSEAMRLPCLCPRLRYLDVSGCPDVETSTLHALVKQRLALSATEAEVKVENVDGGGGGGGGSGGSGGGGGGGESTATSPKVEVKRLEVLKMDGCQKVDVAWLPWFRQHVREVSCIYAPSKKGKRGVARRINGL